MPLVGYNERMSTELAVSPAQGREEPQDDESGRAECSGRPKLSELTPAQLELRSMVLASVTSPHSRRNYAKALDLLFAFAAGRPLTRSLLLEYRGSMNSLAPSTVNVRLAAVRKLVTEARANGMLSAEEAAHLTEVPNIRQRGTRLGNWLTKEQARELLQVPDRETLKGRRDYAILALPGRLRPPEKGTGFSL